MKSPVFRPAIGTGLVLLVPLVMTIVDRHKPAGEGWRWGPLDFVVMGALLFGAGLGYEYFAPKLGNKSHRATLGIGILFAVLGIWVELAVGGISQVLGYPVDTGPRQAFVALHRAAPRGCWRMIGMVTSSTMGDSHEGHARAVGAGIRPGRMRQ